MHKHTQAFVVKTCSKLLAQVHICIVHVINMILDVWMKLKGHMQKQTFQEREQ